MANDDVSVDSIKMIKSNHWRPASTFEGPAPSPTASPFPDGDVDDVEARLTVISTGSFSVRHTLSGCPDWSSAAQDPAKVFLKLLKLFTFSLLTVQHPQKPFVIPIPIPIPTDCSSTDSVRIISI